MLYNLLVPLADSIPLFNLFRYLTFRSGGAVITALTIAFLIGPAVIEWLRSRQGEGQPIRSDGPEGHLLNKKGTPTMGACSSSSRSPSRPCCGPTLPTATSGASSSSPASTADRKRTRLNSIH